MSEYKSFETGTRELWYEKDFRSWLKEHKGLPNTILEATQTVNSKGEKKCVGNICVSCIDINEEDETSYSKSFKIEVGSENFFLKIEQKDIPEDGGFKEMQDTLLAKEVIDSLNISGVRIVKPLLGYSDRTDRSYYITEWMDLPLLEDVLSSMKDDDQRQKLTRRIDTIRSALNGYREVSSGNMFYDKERDEIVLFDLHL